MALKIIVGLVFAAAFVFQVAAQAPSPTPPDDVVRISTSLVQLDLTVTDQKGKPITDLRPDEIELTENGKKQKLTHFAFISSGKLDATSSTNTPGKLVLPPPPAMPRSVRRTIALVADDLSLSWESVGRTKQAMRKFVDEQMQEGDLVAILKTGGTIGVLQQFTDDKRVLNAAIDKLRYNLIGGGPLSAAPPVELTESEAEVSAFLAGAGDTRAGIFTSGTLGSLRYIVNGMQYLPGRKMALLFSDGFRLTARGRTGGINELVMQYMRRLIEDANRAAVVFYAVDPRGLLPMGFTPSDNTQRLSSAQVRAGVLQSSVKAQKDDIWESENGLNMLAQETGGTAFFKNNDLTGSVRKVLEDQSYYLVAFVPDSETFSSATKYNKVDIKVLRKGAVVRHRAGFFGTADTRQIAPPSISKDLPVTDQLRAAIISPFAATAVNLRITSLVGSGPDNASYVRSLIHIDAKGLKFTDEKDGQKTCAFDVLAMSFGADRQPVDQIGKRYSMTITPEVYNKVLEEGFVYHFKFPVTKPGAYQYRVALRDSAAGSLGAASQFVRVPDLSKGTLALSSIALENMSVDEYQSGAATTDAMTDTAIRRIKVGRVYRYSLEIYNAALDAAKKVKLQTQIRVFRDGKLILDGQPKPFDASGQPDLGHLRFFAGLAIGSQMDPGDYVLQVIVTDNARQQSSSQFVQFEVVP